jgi:hypothetical protein
MVRELPPMMNNERAECKAEISPQHVQLSLSQVRPYRSDFAPNARTPRGAP